MDNHEIKALPSLPEYERKVSMAEIRFDAIVKMYDTGTRQTHGSIFGSPSKQLPPQLFVIEAKFTLEGIRYADEYSLGRQLKEMLHQLETHIKNNYESM